jgi:diguanylate cyclase (GGDEF)-like protein/PAS domain S-box-containing protein
MVHITDKLFVIKGKFTFFQRRPVMNCACNIAEKISAEKQNITPYIREANNNTAVERKKGIARFIDDVRLWQQTFDASPDIMFIVDREFNIIRANLAARQDLGDDIIGKKCFKAMYGLDDPFSHCPACHVFQTNNPVNTEQKIFQLENRWFEVSAHPIKDDHGFVWQSLHIYRDITEKKEMSLKLEDIAIKDTLTGVYNRRHFNEIFQREFDLAFRRLSDLSILVLDLDFFKPLVKICGHSYGDLVLKEFADLLQTRIRKTDICARLRGDQFAILLPDADLDEGTMIARNIHSIAEQYVYEDQNNCRQITVTIGLAAINAHTPDSPEDMLAFAQMAMHEAKEEGGNRVGIYTPII